KLVVAHVPWGEPGRQLFEQADRVDERALAVFRFFGALVLPDHHCQRVGDDHIIHLFDPGDDRINFDGQALRQRVERFSAKQNAVGVTLDLALAGAEPLTRPEPHSNPCGGEDQPYENPGQTAPYWRTHASVPDHVKEEQRGPDDGQNAYEQPDQNQDRTGFRLRSVAWTIRSLRGRFPPRLRRGGRFTRADFR